MPPRVLWSWVAGCAAEGQLMLLGSGSQGVEHRARLNLRHSLHQWQSEVALWGDQVLDVSNIIAVFLAE
jgi:hypothetical protein